jgi:iron(III) transport system substrate-binding protein
VLIYNPSLISKSKLPTSVFQLDNPRYRGEIALAPAETDFQPIVTAVVRARGTAYAARWLSGLKTNAGTHIYPDNETIADEVNRGVVAFGVVNQYYWYRLRAEIGASAIRSKIAYFTPGDPGYVVDVSGAGVLRSSSHQAAARDFVAFLVSHEGQTLIAHSLSFEYPIASGVTTAQDETPFNRLHPYPITIAELGNGSTAVSLLQKVGLL